MELFLERLMSMEDKDSVLYGESFITRENDVYISTYPKCGTTWVSLISHCLRSRGNLNFEEIVQVVPWTIFAKDCGIDLYTEQINNPRLFKTHRMFELHEHPARYIYVARDPHDACLSFYHFLLDWVQLTPDDVSIEEFINRMFAAGGSNSGRIWEHYLSYYRQKDNPNVLWIFYEDLITDREKCIEVIANFLGIPLDDELRAITMEQSSFQFMKTHDYLFDEHVVFDACKVRMGFDPDTKVRCNKINKGKQGESKRVLSQEMRDLLDLRWKEVITSQTGIESYQDLRAQLSPLKK